MNLFLVFMLGFICGFTSLYSIARFAVWSKQKKRKQLDRFYSRRVGA